MTPNNDSDSSDSQATDERLLVAVRIRPLKHDEAQKVVHSVDGKMVVLLDTPGDKNDVLRQKRSMERQYIYDFVFGEDSTQDRVYEMTTRNLVKDVLQGYNATVFAYGATGAGKTYTMVGTPQQPGIMVRALNDLFRAVKKSNDGSQYKVTMSYLEIYNENIRDLLNPGSGFLELREDSRGGNIQVAGLSEISTTSTEEVMHLLQKGNRARTVEPTAANKTSSRSHALLWVNVTNSPRPRDVRDEIKRGKLFMIDLAGSERAARTKNRGKRLQEGAHINRSLLALGNCINALSEKGANPKYVNYRDSKLTRLLKEALSGNFRTVMIAHISPSSSQREETRNTLVYADRAKNISKKVQRNVLDVSYHVTQYQSIISELRNEISRLQTKIHDDRPRSNSGRSSAGTKRREEELKTLRESIVFTFRGQMKLRHQLMEIDSRVLGLAMEAERQNMIVSEWESRHNKLYKNRWNLARQRRIDSSNMWGKSVRFNDDTELETDTDLEKESSDSEVDSEEVQQAWQVLMYIEKEQERLAELRQNVERELADCKKKGEALEEELPARISSEEESELLSLMCRVHELEVEKMEMQSETLIKEHELRRRDLMILRYDRQRQLCEEIITRQRQLMEDRQVSLPQDLQELYSLYQQEILAATYPDKDGRFFLDGRDSNRSLSLASLHGYNVEGRDKLPPINNRGPEPLFHRPYHSRVDINGMRRSESDLTLRTPSRDSQPHSLGSTSAVLFPPIPGATPMVKLRDGARGDINATKSPKTMSRLPRPVGKSSGRALRRSASDDNLAATSQETGTNMGTWRSSTYDQNRLNGRDNLGKTRRGLLNNTQQPRREGRYVSPTVGFALSRN